jgi:hypothetical protein
MTAPKRQNVSPQAAEIISRIYSRHAAGCCWHVVLDDENWDSIEFCRQYATENSDTCETGGACQELAAMNVTASILARAKEKLA